MKKKLLCLLTVLSIILGISQESLAVGDLTLTPWRVVFGARSRSAAIELLNTSDVVHTYRMGWALLKATPEGRYEQVPYNKANDKDPHNVANMVIFSPRQVTIEPHGEQIVRLSLRRPADLPPGEYRAHVTFIRMADQAPPEQNPNAKSVQLSMNVNLGFSIPVIVRQGEDKDLKISLSSPQLKTHGKGTALLVNVNRDAGKFSSYGTIEVYWKPLKGDEKKIGEINNFALYPELKARKAIIPITTKENITGGNIHVIYKGKLDSEGTTWAESTFPVGK